MELGLGAVLDGKVTGITKFGAFVQLPAGRTGMVHISEIAHTYVSDIKEHLKEGQDVTVKIIGIDKEGRINLSIKKTLPQPTAAQPSQEGGSGQRPPRRYQTQESGSFEDKLKQFMQDSENKMSDLRHNTDKRGGATRRKK